MNIGFVKVNYSEFGLEAGQEFLERKIQRSRQGLTTCKVTDVDTLQELIAGWEIQLKYLFRNVDKN